MASHAERRALLNEVTTEAATACAKLDDNRDPMTRRVGESLLTSTELLGAEKVLIDAAETTGAPHRPAEMLGVIRLRTEHHLGALAPDQRAAAEAVITSARLLDVLVGPPGSGKTTTLAALTSLWQHGIGSVVGLGAVGHRGPCACGVARGAVRNDREVAARGHPATAPPPGPCGTPTLWPAWRPGTRPRCVRPTRSTGVCGPNRKRGDVASDGVAARDTALEGPAGNRAAICAACWGLSLNGALSDQDK
ncbi:AAA family ATPase [uncultured Cellulomonas sp.]|uniref:AAA family ATPase n=1 Tax=uncultured Cellulomonas sp. TaxID=189682 RepID=UPI0028E30970|nr:AAA family ATPase [uncultured Cellulomonas sp.]